MATKGRIPVPKSQEELSRNLVTPRQKEDQARLSLNPNTGTKLNRGEHISFKDDNTKPFSLGLKDIDEAIIYYFDNVIRPSVSQNGQRIAVPVKYGSPERWKEVQRDGYYRDSKGKIMAPLILFKRNNLKSETLTNKLDGNRLHHFEYFQKPYTKKNAYSKFNIQNGATPTKESYAIVIPDFVTLTYSCIAYTYYVEQLNHIIEAVNFAANSYWGDPERFKFKALIDSFTSITEVNAGENRTVRANFDLRLKGYLIPNVIQKELIAPKKAISHSTVKFTTEAVVNQFPINPSLPDS